VKGREGKAKLVNRRELLADFSERIALFECEVRNAGGDEGRREYQNQDAEVQCVNGREFVRTCFGHAFQLA